VAPGGVTRQAADDRHGWRLRAIIVVFWRGGLRVQEALALAERERDPRRGSLLVRASRNGSSVRSRGRRCLNGEDNANEGSTEMGKIVVSDNVSLDGVIEDPAGDEGFGRGGWVGLIKDRPGANKLALDEALGTEALLLGRRSYEWMAGRWPSRSGELADRLNSLPKYVVSSTLEDPDWNNSTVLKGDVVNEVSKLKQELNGEIVIVASFQLVRTLMEHDLLDELRLKIYPVVLGAGERLFGETGDKRPLRLVDTQTVDGDVAFLTYELVRDA
jgi:dihydrofolate reductase